MKLVDYYFRYSSFCTLTSKNLNFWNISKTVLLLVNLKTDSDSTANFPCELTITWRVKQIMSPCVINKNKSNKKYFFGLDHKTCSRWNRGKFEQKISNTFWSMIMYVTPGKKLGRGNGGIFTFRLLNFKFNYFWYFFLTNLPFQSYGLKNFKCQIIKKVLTLGYWTHDL